MHTRWNVLAERRQLEEIRQKSFAVPQLIFKHSTRCSISSVALNRMETIIADPSIDYYYLDLIRHRELSNLVAETFGVYHESPQILLIRDGACIYDESHLSINPDDLTQELQS